MRRTNANQRTERANHAAIETLMPSLQMAKMMVMMELGSKTDIVRMDLASAKTDIVRMDLESAKGDIGIVMGRTRRKTSIEPSARGAEADVTRKMAKRMRKAVSAEINVATRAKADVMMKIVVMVATVAMASARAKGADGKV